MSQKFNWARALRIIGLLTVSAFAITFAIVWAIRLASQIDDDQPLNLYKEPKQIRTRSRSGSYMKLQNVKFRMTKQVSMNVKSLVAEALPVDKKIVNFDDVNSFAIDIFQGHVIIEPRVMEYIFNNVVFNYEGAPLKETRISFIEVEKDGKKVQRVRSTGKMNLGVWLPFEMIGELKLDKKRVLLYLEAEKITSLGNPYTKSLLAAVGLNMQKLIKVPKNRGLVLKDNRIIIQPFRIFPPPRIGGYLSRLKIADGKLHLFFENSFKVDFPPLPTRASNYIFLYQGDVKFGKLLMVDARMQMVDPDPKDPLDFYLKGYFKPLTRGKSIIKADKSVVAYVPDYSDI